VTSSGLLDELNVCICSELYTYYHDKHIYSLLLVVIITLTGKMHVWLNVLSVSNKALTNVYVLEFCST